MPVAHQRLWRHAADGALSHVPGCAPDPGWPRVAVTRSLVGSYVTSLDMAGCSITVTLLDDELTSLWDAPVQTPALRWAA